ncbi:hypothetical protein [Azospirillum argentinense]|uniref:Uracil-DNA glycosylase-like domain-containing protein n=1 Tax=Azospirillum brasilense TaxID=192 RepID=A0A4D8QAT1_AZOBR|nr:hypothetical protein [Azospirillum argentinense]QCO07495.1 hypothetical protein D3867_37050 [Azospirillum argentinense]
MSDRTLAAVKVPASQCCVHEEAAVFPEIDHLRAAMERTVTEYPQGVVQIPLGPAIRGNGFFPGANGLYIDASGRTPPMPVGKIMVLGHNYDVVRNYRKYQRLGEEGVESVATWRTMLALFRQVSIDPRDCFFTNFYMGLMEDTDSAGHVVRNTDTFPGAQHRWFIDMCVAFLIEQIRVVRPRLVIVLGIKTPSKVALAFRQPSLWSNRETFHDLDRDGRGVLDVVEIAGTNQAPTFVAITHPCKRHLNVHRRRHREHTGEDAETAVLVDGLYASGLWSERPSAA